MPTVIVTEIETGKRIHSGWYSEFGHIWQGVEPVVAEWFNASPDDIQCGEHELHGDVIEIAGKAVATIEHVYRRAELRRPFLQAAE